MCGECGGSGVLHDHHDYDGMDGYGGGPLLGPDGKTVKIVIPLNDLPHARKVDRSDVAGWPDGDAEAEKQTMVALRVPPKVGGMYGKDAAGKVDLEPLQDRHITLVYVGNQPPEERERLHNSVRRWMGASEWQPLDGGIQGWGTFTPHKKGDRNVLWMGWDIPGLAEMRYDLKATLMDEGFEVREDHDFVPHETVGYTMDPIEELPAWPAQPVNHTFDGILVGEGNEDWTEYPFHQGLVYASGRSAVVAALQAAVDDEVAGMSDEELKVLIAAGGADKNRGNAEALRRYWTIGEGGAKIRWNTKGDWKRCVKHLSKHMGVRAKGYCQLRHKEMTALYTGDMKHRIMYGWGGKPGSYWAKVAAKDAKAASEKGVAASGDQVRFIPMDDERAAMPLSDDPANPLMMLLNQPPVQQQRFHIPLLLPEGIESGDGRTFKEGVVEFRDVPIPLLWQPNSMQGHDGAMIVGRIDSMERIAEGIGNASGVFDTSPIAQEAVRMIREGFLRGVSADLDKFEAKILGKGGGTATAGKKKSDKDKDDDVVAPDRMSINKGRIMAATLVAKPAFEQAKIELLEGDMEPKSIVEPVGDAPADAPVVVTASAAPLDGVYRGSLGDGLRKDATRYVARLRRGGWDPKSAEFSLVASADGASDLFAVPLSPPASWFDNPGFKKPTHLSISDDGRVYGHIAAWNVDHIGMGFGTRPPKSKSNYSYFRTGLLRTAEGNDIRVGQITLTGGHASLSAGARDAVKHYDDTNSAFADVVVGEDRHGIWVAGALRPEVTASQVRAARASSPSGDWRPINGRLELVAVCQVNVPGFPVVEARVASGAVVALVAAGTGPLIADLITNGDDVDGSDQFDLDVPAEGVIRAAEATAGSDEDDKDDVVEIVVDVPVGEEPVEEDDTEEGDLEDQWNEDEEYSSEDAAFAAREERRRAFVAARGTEAGLTAAAEAEAAALENLALTAKVRMLRARVGEHYETLTADAGEPDDDDDDSLDDAVRGLTIREAAALLFAAEAEAAAAEAEEEEAITAAVANGYALADGSWWIEDDDDLMAAVEEFGIVEGTRERRVVKNHIKRRARDMGSPDLVPSWWWTERELAMFEDMLADSVIESAIEAAIDDVISTELSALIAKDPDLAAPAELSADGAGEVADPKA